MKREGGFGWSELIAGILLILLGVFTFGQGPRACSQAWW